MNSSYPKSPIAAAMHPDPYPYYAELAATRPLYRDENIGAWVASGAHAVSAVLNSDLCRVRPRNEAVPALLLGTKAGEIFRHLIRMNDGAGHCPFDRAVAVALASVESKVESSSARVANLLVESVDPQDPSTVSQFAFGLSSHVIGELFEIPKSDLGQLSESVGDFVRCVFGSTDAEEIERGKRAATNLWDRFESLLEQVRGTDTLLSRLAQAANQMGCDDVKVVIANGIGFLSQAYEAIAGLISNSLLAFVGRDSQRFIADSSVLREFILEVLRHDPPNHSTRRFVDADGTVGDAEMKAGDVILVLLAAANRDPMANAEPHRFDPGRKQRKLFTFGNGLHACPGDRIALHIVAAGVGALLASGVPLDRLPLKLTYRVSPNTHIPLFA